MGNVIDFPDQSEFKNIGYINDSGELGVSTNDAMLQIMRINYDEFEVTNLKGSHVYDRETLAELLWVAAVFLDSEERWRPDVDLVGCDYE